MKPRLNHTKAISRRAWWIDLQAKYHIDFGFMDQLEGLEMTHEDDGTTILRGQLPDMCALYGLILRMRDAAVEVISLAVRRLDAPLATDPGSDTADREEAADEIS